MPGHISSVNAMPDADIVFYHDFFSVMESDMFFEELLAHSVWKQEHIRLWGRTIALPRLTAWYGDAEKSYTYSGLTVHPHPWTPTLLAIKRRIEMVAEARFNSVLLNLYRDGRDSVSWHSDDEPELGQNPVIGSVSFGAIRRFQFKHKDISTHRTSIDLPHGSLLLMQGATQQYWLHRLPKTTRSCGARINLTFRVIQ
jgi:alkylated DNA repair dioxygenase AlkB